MVEVPITILNSELVEQYKSNGQIIYPYVSFSPNSVTGTPVQACPASYKTHPINTVKVDANNFQYEVEIPSGLNPLQVKTIWLFDQNDELIGYASVNLPYLGSAKLSVRLLVNYTGWPGADPWENMQQMVQNEVNVLETWKANSENISTGIPRLWNRTIYVDQLNGDDGNPGTSDAPVQTLQRAVDLIPIMGRGVIYLLTDYILTSDINVLHKNLSIHLSGVKLRTQWYASGSNAYLYQILLSHSFLSFCLRDNKGVLPQISIPVNGTGNTVYIPRMSLFKIEEKDGPSGVFVRIINQAEGYPIEIRDGAFIGGSDWERISSFGFLGIAGVFYHDVLIATRAYLIRAGHSTWSFSTQDDINFVDENGVAVNISTKIYGIVRDIDGKPRNIISNKVL